MMHVAVGIIQNFQQKILITKRPPQKYKGGLWEFPGGKVENNETVQQALTRELHEEIGIDIIEASPWFQLQHDYGDRVVLLDIWMVTQYSGFLHGKEGQAFCWVFPDEFAQYEFPAGNKTILEKLKNS